MSPLFSICSASGWNWFILIRDETIFERPKVVSSHPAPAWSHNLRRRTRSHKKHFYVMLEGERKRVPKLSRTNTSSANERWSAMSAVFWLRVASHLGPSGWPDISLVSSLFWFSAMLRVLNLRNTCNSVYLDTGTGRATGHSRWLEVPKMSVNNT